MILRKGHPFTASSGWSTIVILFYSLSLSATGSLAGCPKVCECKWHDGKEVVFCRDAHFIDIPRGLAPTTQVLDLQHNNLRILPKDSFVYTGLVSLLKVRLSHCNLMRVEDGAFKNLANVFELDINNNFLKSVPTAALMDMGGLREFRIAHNSITFISSTSFLSTPELVQLDISHNSISAIEVGALRHLIHLEVLDISENKIQTLGASELMLLTVLRVINIDSNPWHCDCQLKPLRKWLNDYGLTPSPPPACSQPRWLVGQKWQLLDLEYFVCAPKVSASAPRVLASEGENVTFVCQVDSEADATITWLVADGPIQYTNESLRFYVSEIAFPKDSIYISNLTLTGVVSHDQGTYRCVAENRAGKGEVNVTLQVSHEVAEVRAANLEPTSYMHIGLLLGITVVLLILALTCSVIYCKMRNGQPEEQDQKMVGMPQPSRSSEEDVQTFTGYHILPTAEMDDQSQKLHMQQHDWLTSGAEKTDKEGRQNDRNSVIDISKEHSEQAGQMTSEPHTNVSYVEISPSGEGVAKTTLGNQVHYKNAILHGKDSHTLTDCTQPLSDLHMKNLTTGYSDPVNGNSLTLHTLNPSFCTLPRGRGKSNNNVKDVTGGREGKSDSNAPSDSNHPYNFEYRSSSALNLSLCEATSSTYAYGPNDHLPTGGSSLQSQDHRSMQDLTASQKENLNVSRGQEYEGNRGGQDPYRFEYHAAQLENFLQEYRSLQQQLQMMKHSYQAHHRTESVPRLETTIGKGNPSLVILESSTSPNQLVNNPFIHLTQPSASIPDSYLSSQNPSASLEPFASSAQYFCTPTQLFPQYSINPLNISSQTPVSLQSYPTSDQCFVPTPKPFASSLQPCSDLSRPCLATSPSYTTPLRPYTAESPTFHQVNQQASPSEGKGDDTGGGCEPSVPSSDFRPTPICSEVTVSSPTVTFLPSSDIQKSRMLNKGAQPEEPLKSILKKTSSDGKMKSKSPKQQSSKAYEEHQPVLKKKQMGNQGSS